MTNYTNYRLIEKVRGKVKLEEGRKVTSKRAKKEAG